MFQEKVIHSYTNRSILAEILSKITRFFQIFLKFEPRFKYEKILKNWPIHKPTFVFYKGSFIYQEIDFTAHVGGTPP